MKKIKLLFIVIIAFSFTMIQSCKEEISGCLYEEACNYNSSATEDDGSCYYAEEYYDCDDQCINDTDNDGICDELENAGCTVPSACNYDPTATNNDGSCFFAEEYYNCAGDCLNDFDNDGICDELEIEGCNDPEACNYTPNATDIGGCEYAELGFTCEGTIDPIYTVEQLFIFGLTFGDLINNGINPTSVDITTTTLLGCSTDGGPFDTCWDPYLSINSSSGNIITTDEVDDDCTAPANFTQNWTLSTSLFSDIIINVYDYDALASNEFVESVSLNFWEEVINYASSNNLNNLSQSPDYIEIVDNDGTSCPTLKFYFTINW